MENLDFIRPVVVKKYHLGSTISRPFTVINCYTAKYLLVILTGYTFEKCIFDDNGELSCIMYKHKVFNKEICTVNF